MSEHFESAAPCGHPETHSYWTGKWPHPWPCPACAAIAKRNEEQQMNEAQGSQIERCEDCGFGLTLMCHSCTSLASGRILQQRTFALQRALQPFADMADTMQTLGDEQRVAGVEVRHWRRASKVLSNAAPQGLEKGDLTAKAQAGTATNPSGPQGPSIPAGAAFDAWDDIRVQMKGYWISRTGKLSVTYHVPSMWERVWAWFDGESWVRYER